ncbi:MAG: FGGY family carbohydrate kinase, partial [Actinomycetota bacterium]|nr:FGGY family carbohydrate kinase [Actinomycetota bacterium]
MADERRCTVGLDLGTSGMKGVALDGSGRVAARAQCGYPTSRPEPGASEQDPGDWLRATASVLGELASACDPRGWAGIGLSGMIPTLVAADARGEAIGAAVTWEDARADSFATSLEDAVGARALFEVTGQRVDGRYLVPMLLRLLEEARGRGRTERPVATIRSAKDHLFAWLTGDLATDPSTATGFGCYDLLGETWSAPVTEAAAALAGGALPELPPIVASTTWSPLQASRAAALGLPA